MVTRRLLQTHDRDDVGFDRMPFTPFHMGPAAILKLAGLGYFSFTVFGYSQILTDLEPLIRLSRDDDILHGHSHTYVGALLIGVAAAVSGKYLCEFGLKTWNVAIRRTNFHVATQISWSVAATSALIGTFSHVLLDSVMHADMLPLWPFSDTNGMLYRISVSQLHAACVIAGIVGGAGLLALWIRKKVLMKIPGRSR